MNVLNYRSYSPLHIASLFGKTDCVKALLEAGASHDDQPIDKNTPLALAVNGGHLDVMKLLLPLGCDVNNADKDFDTPLHYAAYNGMVEGVNLLIEYGANPDVCNRVNTSVLWNAVFRNHTDVVYQLLIENVRMEISSRGRDPAPSDVDVYFYGLPKSPLYVAVDKKCRDIVQLLISAGYNIQKETWLLEGDIPKNHENEELLSILMDHIQTPDRLLTICRNTIRQYLGRNVCKKIERLDIPQHLKNCLALKGLLDDIKATVRDNDHNDR